jgi:hypothetical protein
MPFGTAGYGDKQLSSHKDARLKRSHAKTQRFRREVANDSVDAIPEKCHAKIS